MRGKIAVYPDERIGDFKKAMEDVGFSYYTSRSYAAAVARYIKHGGILDKEYAKDYFTELRRQGKNEAEGQASVLSFIGFINGEPVKRRVRKNSRRIYYGCNEDCFNCVYDDCMLPYQKCKSIPYEEWVGSETKSEANRAR